MEGSHVALLARNEIAYQDRSAQEQNARIYSVQFTLCGASDSCALGVVACHDDVPTAT